MKRYFITLYDIGLKRLTKRIFRNIQKIFDKLLCASIKKRIYRLDTNQLNFNLVTGWPEINDETVNEELKEISFTFLNDKRTLFFPLKWEYKNLPRLWTFQLHSFDWSKKIIENRIFNKEAKSHFPIELLIDNWIEENKLGKFDGWHSYTISLRIRNWIWLFLSFPKLKNRKRILSLWMQLRWLDSHPEDYLGGNHYLENLIAICLCTLFFDSEISRKIYKKNLENLKRELDSQILNDGGHQERTASYHVLILDRLVELSFFIKYFNKKADKEIFWLDRKINLMTEWAQKILVHEKDFPSFNDSPIDGCPNINKVINFANSYLYEFSFDDDTIRRFINGISGNTRSNGNQFYKKKNKILEDLRDTGWTIIRPGGNYELFFKCGESCPKHLPPHAHSDLLSFDLFKKGRKVFIESGTSTYSDPKIRNYERSGASHNVLQLACIKRGLRTNNVKWIEPIDVWGTFRAGNKSKIIKRDHGIDKSGYVWAMGEHDGYKKYGATHKRLIKSVFMTDGKLNLIIEDEVYCSKPMFLRQWWHLGPEQNNKLLLDIKSQFKKSNYFKSEITKTFLADGFGKRIIRNSLCIYGIIKPGNYILSVNLII